MLNLFILIIIQQFEDFHLKEDNPITHFKKNLDSFSKIWAEFTEASHGLTINSKKLIDFYMRLDPPLGFGSNIERTKMALEIMKMNLSGFFFLRIKQIRELFCHFFLSSDEEGNIYFNELLFDSMKRVFGQEILSNVSNEIKEMMENQEKQIKARLERRTFKMINSFYGESPVIGIRRSAISRDNSPLKNQHKKQIVNPMITILFVGMVFKSWKRYNEHFVKGELDQNGSVILTKQQKNDEDDDEYEESEESFSSNGENKLNSLSSSEKEDSEEDEDENKDKGEIAFNMLDKFIIRKQIAEENDEDEQIAEMIPTNGIKRSSQSGNMFRTFFASNESKIRLQKP